MWFEKATVYRIYPLGFCNAPKENDAERKGRILHLADWIERIKLSGADTVLLNPIFESDRHGYDTRDYFSIDCRLGSNDDFKKVSKAFHDAGLKLVLDGVFNHVGRGFWAFRDVREKKWDSPYKDWFNINFDGNSPYNDGFWYEGWEGHFELVKLNLRNENVVNHRFEAIKSWVERFDIDGLRLDVAYCLPPEYLKKLRSFTSSLKSDFWLCGETLHGDYNRWMSDEMCRSVTNYECYKGLWSSFNSSNLFEICHSLARQFGPEGWTLYKGRHLLSFLDNHDVTRIASKLSNPEHLPLAYGLIFGMPGIPAIYYGSEWGEIGRKEDGDDALRPHFETGKQNELTKLIANLSEIRKNSEALLYGGFRNVNISNLWAIFERRSQNETILVALNASENAVSTSVNGFSENATDLISKKEYSLENLTLEPYSLLFLKI